MNEFHPTKIPNLITASSGPIMALEKHILDNQLIIEAWLRDQWQLTPPVFYCSSDLRNAGFKVAPVDTNLFPAGFNNLNPEFLPLCIQAVQSTMEKICPELSKILIIAESHTRNMFYYESLASLQNILLKAGFQAEIGSLLADLHEPKNIELPSGRRIKVSPLKREANRIGVDDFSPCLILLNNDLSEGVPDILQNLDQKIMPPAKLGWATRLKSQHFHYYQEVSQALANRIQMDPWLITPLFRSCGEINFMTGEGEASLIENTQALLNEIQKKYTEYNVDYPPFVVVKADSGTYGMAVMTIKNAEELAHLNRKQRVQMSKSKGGQSVSKVIIQEGIYTFETWGKENAVAEPVVYMIGRHVVGGFYRVHANRDINENLNAPGMNFEPLAFADSCNNPCRDEVRKENRFYIYGVIARLAALAAAHEMKG